MEAISSSNTVDVITPLSKKKQYARDTSKSNTALNKKVPCEVILWDSSGGTEQLGIFTIVACDATMLFSLVSWAPL